MGGKTASTVRFKNVNIAPALISRPKMRTVTILRMSGRGLLILGAGMLVGSYLTLRCMGRGRRRRAGCCEPEATAQHPVC